MENEKDSKSSAKIENKELNKDSLMKYISYFITVSVPLAGYFMPTKGVFTVNDSSFYPNQLGFATICIWLFIASIPYTYKRMIKLWQKTKVILNCSTLRKLEDENAKLKTEIEEYKSKKKNETDEEFVRFENIHGKVKVGVLPFMPTLKCDHGYVEGPGKLMIDYIFGESVNYMTDKPLDWNNMLTALNKKEYDILATPVYDTPNRRNDCEFSMPLYYADMGIFIGKNSKLYNLLRNEEQMSFDFLELTEKIRNIKEELSTLVNTGEVNQLILTKHFEKIKPIEDTREFVVDAALSQLPINSESNREIVICERFIGERHKTYKEEGSIVNILKNKQLLYPVVFIMRQGEQELRKYVNLRLMQLFDEDKFHDLLVKGLKEVGATMNPNIDSTNSPSYFYRGEDSDELIISTTANKSRPVDDNVVNMRK